MARPQRIEAKNQFENYLYSIKNQVNDEKQLGGKLAADDKETILSTIKEKTSWFESNAESATKEVTAGIWFHDDAV